MVKYKKPNMTKQMYCHLKHWNNKESFIKKWGMSPGYMGSMYKEPKLKKDRKC